MPTYLYNCTNAECNNSWEDFHDVNDVQTTCPECKQETAKRMITGGFGVSVVLTGNELKAHLKSEGQKLKRDCLKKENLLANIVGEDKYQQNQKDFGK